MRYLFVFAILFATPVFAQFETRTSFPQSSDLKKTTPGEIDFVNIDCKTDLSSLTGDEVYFPTRAKGGQLGHMEKIKNMVSTKTSEVEDKLDWTEVYQRHTQIVNSRGLSGKEADALLEKMKQNGVVMTPTNVYKPEGEKYQSTHELNIFTPYAAIENKFFKILSCEVIDKTVRSIGNCEFVFKLQDADGEQLTWTVPGREINATGAYLKKYLVELKKRTAGNYYIALKDGDNNVYNAINGRDFRLVPEGRYQCADIIFMNEGDGQSYPFCKPHFIFKDSTGGQFAISTWKETNARLIARKLMVEPDYVAKKAEEKRQAEAVAEAALKEEALEQKQNAARVKAIEKKFGKATAKLILNGEVKLGMSKEACRESWGGPARKSETATAVGRTETWIYYDHRYLTFVNGVLKSYTGWSE